MATKERFSNFELLRIISMVLIVMHHFSMHGSYDITATSSVFNEGILNLFIVGGKLGSNVFILISGYFLINSKFKIKKIIKLVLQVLFYAIGIYLLFIVMGEQEFSWKLLLYNIFPISTRRYWFMTWYVVLYLLSPLLNKILKKLSKEKHKNLILVLLLVQILMIPLTFQVNGVGEGFWFITLYIIGSYIRLYNDKIFNNQKVNLAVFGISFLIMACASVFGKVNLYDMGNVVCIICSLSMFCFFKNLKIKSNMFINDLSGCCLGVYLIHDNKMFRYFLWDDLLQVNMHFQQNTFIVFAIVSVVLIFVGCASFEYIRQNTIGRLEDFVLSKFKRKEKIKIE